MFNDLMKNKVWFSMFNDFKQQQTASPFNSSGANTETDTHEVVERDWRVEVVEQAAFLVQVTARDHSKGPQHGFTHLPYTTYLQTHEMSRVGDNQSSCPNWLKTIFCE